MKSIFIFLFAFFATQEIFAENTTYETQKYKTLIDDGYLAQKEENHKLAIKLFKKALPTDSIIQNKHALNGLVKSLQFLNKWDESFEVINLQIEKYPFDVDYRYQLVDSLIAYNKFNSALIEIGYIEKITGPLQSVLKYKSDVQFKLGHYADCINTLTEMLKNTPLDYSLITKRADARLRMNDLHRALNDLRSIYYNDPGNSKMYSVYSEVAFKLNRYSELKRVTNKCLSYFPGQADCHIFLGKVYFFKQQHQKAVKHFENSITVDSKNQEGRLYLAETLALLNKPKESNEHFDVLLNQYPNFELGIRSWSYFLKQQKNTVELGSALSQFTSFNVQNTWGVVEYCYLLSSIGQEKTCTSKLKKLTEDNPNPTNQLFYSYFLYKFGNSKKSLAVLKSLKHPLAEKLSNRQPASELDWELPEI